jgi:uncharacterized protein (DUF1697 family)
MRYVAFFRNLNLGRRNCPDRVQFEQAFLEAGASAAASFLTNGTMAFEARSRRAAENILENASASMAARCGLREPAFLRGIDQLAALVETAPFGAIDPATVFACCVTFLHRDAAVASRPPSATPRGDVEVISFTGSEVLCIVRKFGKNPGSPNAFLEKALALPATTRVWNTVVRLVDKHT